MDPINQAVDENYDPTEFLQSLCPGEILGTNPLPMVVLSHLFCQQKWLQVLQDGTVIKAEPEESSETRLKVGGEIARISNIQIL